MKIAPSWTVRLYYIRSQGLATAGQYADQFEARLVAAKRWEELYPNYTQLKKHETVSV